MSTVVKCNGPDCVETRDPDGGTRLCDLPWLRVEGGGGLLRESLDFHDKACLAKWALAGAVADGSAARSGALDTSNRAMLDDCTSGWDCVARLHVSGCPLRAANGGES